jgi:hypothetical protein
LQEADQESDFPIGGQNIEENMKSSWLNAHSKRWAIDLPSQNGTLEEFLSEEFQDGVKNTLSDFRVKHIHERIDKHEGIVFSCKQQIKKLESEISREERLLQGLRSALCA